MERYTIRLEAVNVEDWLYRDLASRLSFIFNAKIATTRSISPSRVLEHYEEERGQIRADTLIEDISGYLPPLTLVLIDGDAYVLGLNFVFGIAKPGWGGIVFITRLKPEFYGQPSNRELLTLRLFKEAVHELGHALGLDHCRSSRCVMRFSNSIIEVDAKTPYFCARCSRRLKTLYPDLLK